MSGDIRQRIFSVLLSFIGSLIFISGCSRDITTVAKVNGEKITYRQYREAYEKSLLLLGKKELSGDEKKEIIDDLVTRELLRQGAVKAGIQVTDNDIALEAGLRRGKMTEREFEDELITRHMDLSGFKRAIVTDILINRLRISLSQGVSLTNDEIYDYYDGHMKDFMVPALYKVYIFKTFGEDEAIDLLRRFKYKGDDFDKWAILKGPEDVRRINMQAMLTPETNFPDDMASMLKDMKVGDIGGPVRAKGGHFIFKLLEKQEGRQRPVGEVVTEIRHVLLEEKKEEKINNWVEKEKTGAKVEVKMRF